MRREIIISVCLGQYLSFSYNLPVGAGGSSDGGRMQGTVLIEIQQAG